MGLIEKAFQVDNLVTDARSNVDQLEKQVQSQMRRPEMGQQNRPQQNAPHQNGSQSNGSQQQLFQQRQARQNAERIMRQCKQFDLDMSRLKRQGFFTTSEKTTQLMLELRYLKRRLLRLLGFLRSNSTPNGLDVRSGDRRNTVMVTSTRPAEGKTFTSINLALSLALEDEIDVLLVDADCPRPKVQSHFGLQEQYGLTDLMLNADLRLEDVGLKSRQGPLTIVPEGHLVDRPSDLFGSSAAQRTLNMLKKTNKDQIVVIDAPPVLATTEAIVLAPYVDEILFVVEADSTPEQAITSALEELLDVNPNISLVLNKCLIGAGGSHYESYSEYYPRGARRENSLGTPGDHRRDR